MLVSATATNISGGPLTLTDLTLADGSFNITVDANPEFITPYMVEVSPNYHWEVNWIHRRREYHSYLKNLMKIQRKNRFVGLNLSIPL